MKKIKDKIRITKLKEMWKDKKGRAKIELSLYLIFFIVIVVFTRVSSSSIGNSNNSNNVEVSSFINELKDNYEYDMNITINNDTYNYHGILLGNNSSIEVKSNDIDKYYYIMNNKYYELDDNGNYILTTTDDVYPYINYIYLNINNIKNFINNSVKEDNIYKIKISDIILNSTSTDSIIISVNESNKSIEIDYTNLLKIDTDSVNKANVVITFSNINNIISLEK